MYIKIGVGKLSKKFIAIFTLLLVLLQCFPMMALGETGKPIVIRRGNTPTKPSNLKASVLTGTDGSKSIYLNWDVAVEKESGIKQYDIYRNGAYLASTKMSRHCDVTVKPENKYQYKVIAIANNGSKSNPATSNTVSLVTKRKVINAKTGAVSYKPLSSEKISLDDNPNYKKTIHLQTGKISYTLKNPSKVDYSSWFKGLKLVDSKTNLLSPMINPNAGKYNLKTLFPNSAFINNTLSNNSTKIYNSSLNTSLPNLKTKSFFNSDGKINLDIGK